MATQTGTSAPGFAPSRATRRQLSLHNLMNFYESGEDAEGDESEVELMIQLSGMVGGVAGDMA